MKKILLLLLCFPCFVLAQARESSIPVEKSTGSYHHTKHTGPHSELDLSVSFNTTSPIFRTVKKLTGGAEFPASILPVVGVPEAVFIGINNSLYSKSYLTHIHPSHHFS